jgi:hypothetical protein
VRGVKIHRIPKFGPVHDIRVGPSFAKILWNIALIFKVMRVVWRERLDVLHGINYEGAMIGWAAKVVTGRPLVYGAVNTKAWRACWTGGCRAWPTASSATPTASAAS